MPQSNQSNFKRWEPEGSDAVYLYRELVKNHQLTFKQFIANHRDWAKRYKTRNLSNNFTNCKKKLNELTNGGESKFNCVLQFNYQL